MTPENAYNHDGESTRKVFWESGKVFLESDRKAPGKCRKVRGKCHNHFPGKYGKCVSIGDTFHFPTFRFPKTPSRDPSRNRRNVGRTTESGSTGRCA